MHSLIAYIGIIMIFLFGVITGWAIREFRDKRYQEAMERGDKWRDRYCDLYKENPDDWWKRGDESPY